MDPPASSVSYGVSRRVIGRNGRRSTSKVGCGRGVAGKASGPAPSRGGMRAGVVAIRGRRTGPAPGGFFAGFSLSCTDSFEPSSWVPLRPADRRLGSLLGGDIDKPVAQLGAGDRVARDRRAQHDAERVECLGQPLFGKIGRQIADKDIALVLTRAHLPPAPCGIPDGVAP